MYDTVMDDIEKIKTKYQLLSGRFDESTLRVWAAAEALSLGRGGVSAVAKAIRISRTTIHMGLSELTAADPSPSSKPHHRPRVRA